MNQQTIDNLAHACNILTQMTGLVRDETNEVVATDDHVKVIKHYDQLRQITALIKESREALSQIEEKMSREQVPDVLRAHNIRTITVEGVGRVSLGTRWSASMPDKAAGFEWLRGNNHGGVIQETVNAQTLGALAKELNAEGTELPAPTFTTNIMTYTSITKVK
jgi:hypothetical protein